MSRVRFQEEIKKEIKVSNNSAEDKTKRSENVTTMVSLQQQETHVGMNDKKDAKSNTHSVKITESKNENINRQIISKEIIEILEKFSIEMNVKAPSINSAAKSLFTKIHNFSQLDEKEQPKQIDSVRKLFLDVYNNKELPDAFIMDIDFKKLIYNILIKLAERFPINSMDSETGLPLDPILYTPIEKNNQFYTMTGQVFSVNTVIDYNRGRMARNSLEEKPLQKFLINPLTNLSFLPMDMENLIIIAAKKEKILDFLIDQPTDSKESHAELSQQYSLKDLASLANQTNLKRTVNFTSLLDYTQEEAIACIILCARNNEQKTCNFILDTRIASSKSSFSPEMALGSLGTNLEITPSSALQFICLLAIFNEPKTLRELANICFAGKIDIIHKYKGGVTAIHMAAQYGSMEAMEVLLDPQYKVDINIRNACGATAVNVAANHKKNHIVKMLAEKKANLMIPDYLGQAPIHHAAENNNTNLMELLLVQGVQINQKSTKLEKTAAHYAAESNSKEVTELLLDKKADFTLLSREGMTPVQYAAYHGSIDVMRVLLQHKDNVFPDQPQEGQSSHFTASIAAEKGYVQILELLAKSNIDLSKPRVNSGETPLHRAVFNGHYEATKFLIENYLTNQKDIFIKHTLGQSPFLFACGLKHWNIAKLFLNKVAEDKMSQEDKILIEGFREELGLTEIASTSNSQLLTTQSLFSQNSTSVNSQTIENKRRNSFS